MSDDGYSDPVHEQIVWQCQLLFCLLFGKPGKAAGNIGYQEMSDMAVNICSNHYS